MIHERALRQLGRFLHLLAIALFAGTILELIAAKHYDEPTQLIPFLLCGLGIGLVALAWARPTARTIRWLRVAMLVIAGGSLLGVYFHVSGNMEFAREIHPDASFWTLLRAGLQGRDPLLAPGVLAVAAAVAIAATSTATALMRAARPGVVTPSRQRETAATALRRPRTSATPDRGLFQ